MDHINHGTENLLSIDNAINKKKESMPLLCHTTNLSKIEIDIFKPLKEAYVNFANSKPIIKYMLTLTNAILTQRRFFFCLSRDTFAKMVKNDVNLKKEDRTFSNKHWKQFLAVLFNSTIKVVEPGKGNRLAIYAVTSLQLQNLIIKDIVGDQINEELTRQMNETKEFSLNKLPDAALNGKKMNLDDIKLLELAEKVNNQSIFRTFLRKNGEFSNKQRAWLHKVVGSENKLETINNKATVEINKKEEPLKEKKVDYGFHGNLLFIHSGGSWKQILYQFPNGHFFVDVNTSHLCPQWMDSDAFNKIKHTIPTQEAYLELIKKQCQ